MTKAEIVKSYQDAKYKSSQIKILSELACKPVKEIEQILIDAGEKIPQKRKAKTEEPKNEEPKNKIVAALEKDIKEEMSDYEPKKLKDMPENVRNALTSELRRLDAEMAEIQAKKSEIIEFMLEKD